MSESSDNEPHGAEVIGFVSRDGELLDNSFDGEAYRLLINLGSNEDVKVGERVIVFQLGSKIQDPETGESLGHFEVVRGEGKVDTVQPKMAVISSSSTRSEKRPRSIGALALAAGATPGSDYVTVSAPFRKPKIGDLVRFI